MSDIWTPLGLRLEKGFKVEVVECAGMSVIPDYGPKSIRYLSPQSIVETWHCVAYSRRSRQFMAVTVRIWDNDPERLEITDEITSPKRAFTDSIHQLRVRDARHRIMNQMLRAEIRGI